MPLLAPRQTWLFSARTDVLAFSGVALASMAVVFGGRAFGLTGTTPLWLWLVLVLGIDVAHVWSTLFRVYLDGEARAKHGTLFFGLPIAIWAVGVALHHHAPLTFWRALAYVAVWHFVRQQYGWMSLYGRKEGASTWTRRFDAAAIYAATLGPLIWWHANLPRDFAWFVDHDFFVGFPHWVGSVALAVHAMVLVGWLVAQLLRAVRGAGLQAGKLLLVSATWTVWFCGIVLAPDDVSFTVFNIALHGIPYFVLLFRYAKGRAAEGVYGGTWILRGGAAGFIAFLVALAFVEELLWDRLVWGERAIFFGAGHVVSGALLDLLVPLLALPQATHYVLDAFIWKPGREPRLLERLGWAPPTVVSATEPATEPNGGAPVIPYER